GGGAGCGRPSPPFRGRRFAEMSNPRWFRSDPALAWGFFGHRMNLYRSAVPHQGFEILRRWGERLPHGYFVFTSNVDGQFQKAGFSADRILECHGSIHFLQCTERCGRGTWPSGDTAGGGGGATIRAGAATAPCRAVPAPCR